VPVCVYNVVTKNVETLFCEYLVVVFYIFTLYRVPKEWINKLIHVTYAYFLCCKSGTHYNNIIARYTRTLYIIYVYFATSRARIQVRISMGEITEEDGTAFCVCNSRVKQYVYYTHTHIYTCMHLRLRILKKSKFIEMQCVSEKLHSIFIRVVVWKMYYNSFHIISDCVIFYDDAYDSGTLGPEM